MQRNLTICCIVLLSVVVCSNCDRRSNLYWQNAALNSSRNGLQIIWEAVVKYRKEHGQFPRGIGSAVSEGEVGLSWRVYLLPFLGEQEEQLFDKFHLDEPWNSKHNLNLLDAKPVFYESPIKGGDRTSTTCFLAVLSSGASNEQRQDEETKKSPIMVVEVDQDLGVPWTKPVDLDCPIQEIGLQLVGRHGGKYLVLLRDGSIESRVGEKKE